MSNYDLVRILVLRFVIPYASTKVNSYAMKLYSTCGALFGVWLCLMLAYEIFSSLGWMLLNLSLHFICTKYDHYLCIQNPLN